MVGYMTEHHSMWAGYHFPLQCVIILKMRHEIGLPDGGSPQIFCSVSPLKMFGVQVPGAHLQWLRMTNGQ